MDPVVKELHTGDIPTIVRMAGMLREEVAEQWPGCPAFNLDLVVEYVYQYMILRVMHAIGLFVGEECVGVAVFTVYPCLIAGCVLGRESLLYVVPEHRGSGLALIGAFEKMAREKGAEMLEIGHSNALNGPKMCRLYSSLGYELHLLSYIKRA